MHLFSRREILVGMGAAGFTPLLVSVGCSSDGGSNGPPLPELPEYEWIGPLGPENLFEHGVASGDPLPDGVIIWTRISSETAPAEPPESNDPLSVWWEVALDEAFERRVKQGTVRTNPASDFTVKVDVSELVWGRNYYYRFFAQGRQSPVGRTRLAPSGEGVSQLRFGVCACASYGRGWFHGYRHMAERADLDAVLHLGDYTYEYGNDDGFPFIREVDPPHETVTLEDYRTRLSQYRHDPDLQECHRQHPFIVVWDDHESANDSWMGGAENHDPETEGSWDNRLAVARQAFFEWIPLRERADQQIYRTFKYGDLADIIMLDTRIEGRQEQCGPEKCTAFFADDPLLSEDIISTTQEAWLKDQLLGSTARWRILGNQVPMSLWLWENTDEPKYFYWDQWHAYPEGRARVMEFLRDEDIDNVVIVTGDVHSSWAMDVTVGDGSYDPQTRSGAVAVEFVAPGITAPNPFGSFLSVVVSASPHVRYAELEHKGYFVLDVQDEKVQADWYLLDGVEQSEGNESLDASWAVMDGERHVVEMNAPEAPLE